MKCVHVRERERGVCAHDTHMSEGEEEGDRRGLGCGPGSEREDWLAGKLPL